MAPPSPMFSFASDLDTGVFESIVGEWLWYEFFNQIDWEEIT